MKTLQIWTAFLCQPEDYLSLSPTLLFCLLVLFGTVSVAGADDPLTSLSSQVSVVTETPVEDKDGALPTLAPILVVAPPLDFTTGQTSLSSELIKQLPSGNGSIFELLPVLPGIQFTDQAYPSAMGGEIDPAPISIVGGKVYQNNVLLDGLSITNWIDPMAMAPEAANAVPLRLQEILPNWRIIETVQVFDHNIPARYGGFTGGAVKLETRKPQPEVGGSLNYRATRDGWTHFHISEANRVKFENSNDVQWQPRFSKYDTGFDVNLPLSASSGAIAAYQLVQSRIPLDSVDGKKNRSRRQENFFLKWVGALSAKDKLELSVTSTPFRGDYFLVNVKNGEFDIDKKAYILGTSWRRTQNWGEMELKLGYQYSKTGRSAPDHFFTWLATDSKDWGRLNSSTISLEGGYGDLESSQEQYYLTTNWDLSPWTTGSVQHLLNGGVELGRITGQVHRQDTTYYYWKPSTSTDYSSLDCGNNSFDCVDREQLFTKRSVYGAAVSSATLTVGSVYLQDKVLWRRLELRPGLRLSRDDYLFNTNVEPRLATSLDLFGNHGTVLIAGMNRYYGLPVLAFKLRSGQPYRDETRGLVTDPWQTTKTTMTSDGSNLKSPYADELSVGVNQDLWGGRLDLVYIRREGHDELATEATSETLNGQSFRYISPNNNGRSRHESYRAVWDRNWPTVILSMNITYQQSYASVEGYDTSLDSAALNRRIWYKGEVLFPEDLPRKDFNRSWVANMVLVKKLPYGMAFTNVTKYRSGYHYLGNTRVKAPPPNEDLYIYDDIHKHQSWLFDWKISWRKKLAPHFEPALIVEVKNVFNRKILIGSEDDEYEQGRQYWAGMECKF